MQVFTDASVKKLWEEDGLLAIHKPWGMRVYLPQNDAGHRYRTPMFDGWGQLRKDFVDLK